MNRFRFTLTALALVAFTFTLSANTQAQSVRTWVSGVGDDVNPCSRTAPCKTFAGAITRTAAFGEISVLDPGSFGTLTITKSLTVNGEGNLAGVTGQLTNGFTINAGANDIVNIRYIAFNGMGNGLTAIRFLAGKSVNIENVSITGFTTGIEINKTSDGNLSIINSAIKHCSGAGIRAETSAGLAKVVVRNSSVTNCSTGIKANRNSRVGVNDSSISLNTIGIHVEGNSGVAVAFVKNCQIANNTGVGVQAGGGAATTSSFARLSNNAIHNNSGAGVTVGANGIVDTFDNNEIIGNSPDGCVGCSNVTTFLN